VLSGIFWVQSRKIGEKSPCGNGEAVDGHSYKCANVYVNIAGVGGTARMSPSR
jgi:hypothetical protein